MRSIVVFLRAADLKSVTGFLLRHFKPSTNGWMIDGNVYVYAGPFPEPAEQDILPPDCSPSDYIEIMADVSGRIPGDEEVREFLELVLTEFGGFVFDDYTGHPWTLEEIRHGHREQGHPFFDYRGWYDQYTRSEVSEEDPARQEPRPPDHP